MKRFEALPGAEVGNPLVRYKNPRAVGEFATGWYGENTCPACGKVNASMSHAGKLCRTVTTCKLCGLVQCSGASGTCRLCRRGLLAGYSGHDDECDYASCHKEAVARGIRGKKRVCREHYTHQFGEDAIPSEAEVKAVTKRFRGK